MSPAKTFPFLIIWNFKPIFAMNEPVVKACACQATTPIPPKPPPEAAVLPAAAKQTVRSLRSVLLSVLIAFFPKCPLCWAAYMSMFGSLGLANTPYMGWLLPVLVGVLGIHLYLLAKKIPHKGYGPFGLSLAGALLVVRLTTRREVLFEDFAFDLDFAVALRPLWVRVPPERDLERVLPGSASAVSIEMS